MNNNLHELVFIVDKTASSVQYENATSEIFKALVKSQKDVDCGANVTISSFGAENTILFQAKPIEKVRWTSKLLGEHSGVNCFLDSSLDTINEVGKRLADTPEEERPAKVIVTMTVLGRDNASKKTTYDMLREIIEHQSYVYKWKFFLVTDFSINMEKLGISPDDTIILSNGSSPKDKIKELSNKITEYRHEVMRGCEE